MASQFKTFVAGDVLTASEVNSYLMGQSVIVCDSSSDYPSSPVEGMVIFDKALNRGLFYTGSAWLPAFGSMPGCQAVLSTQMSIADTTSTAAELDGADIWDTDGFHDPASNNTRITIPTGLGGRYLFTARMSFVANTTGHRILRLRVNGGSLYGYATAEGYSVDSSGMTTAYELNLAATDYVEAMGEHTMGSNLNMAACIMTCRWVSGPDPD